MGNPTGGLGYHVRALRYRSGLWAPFRQSLEQWLSLWQPREKKLLLVGPSAGHCLPEAAWFEARFPEGFVAVDPDPWARFGLQLRLGRARSWIGDAGIAPKRGRFEPEAIVDLLAQHPDHAVLFCNLLGQFRFLDQHACLGSGFRRWKETLSDCLEGRSFASFHDRLSGEACPVVSPLETASDVVSDSDILSRFYGGATGARGLDSRASGRGWTGGKRSVQAASQGVLLDHLTGDLFPGHSRTFFHWEIVPGYHHLIEAVQAVAPAGQG